MHQSHPLAVISYMRLNRQTPGAMNLNESQPKTACARGNPHACTQGDQLFSAVDMYPIYQTSRTAPDMQIVWRQGVRASGGAREKSVTSRPSSLGAFASLAMLLLCAPPDLEQALCISSF